MKEPYIVFQGTRTQDGKPFPVNEWVGGVQRKANLSGECQIGGNILIAKVQGINAGNTGGVGSVNMSDLVFVKNFFLSQPW